MSAVATKALLELDHLSVDYVLGDRRVRAVDNVSLSIAPGEILGLAGESGCGKSTLASAVLQILKPPAEVSGGRILFQGQDLVAMSREDLRRVRWRHVSLVFQSAMNVLNPVMRVGDQFVDMFKAHDRVRKADALARAGDLLELVGIDRGRVRSYPHELSGGMRQRVVIAMALALEPELIVMDEPTTALDVVVQREILQELEVLKERLGFAVLFITHDLSLLVEFSDRIAIMYAGEIVESAASDVLFRHALHPYTNGLMSSFPPLTGPIVPLTGIPGSPPDLAKPPSGCRFHPRCPQCTGIDSNLHRLQISERPVLRQIDARPPGRLSLGGRAMSTLEVQRLGKRFPVRGAGLKREMLDAVADVSFTLSPGRVTALVGESGSGKSTVARLLARLYAPTDGRIVFDGHDVSDQRRRRTLLDYRSHVQMIFQDPFASLNPVKRIDYHIARPLQIHHICPRGAVDGRVRELLARVGLVPPDEIAQKYPHQLSGGQRQRVAIARALAVEPSVILADEPISMLDVSIRIGILNLILQLKRELGIAFLYITHDIASARYVADEVLVMYRGRIVEQGPTDSVLLDPQHAYTKLLLSAVPNPESGLRLEPLVRAKLADESALSLVEVRPGHYVRREA